MDGLPSRDSSVICSKLYHLRNGSDFIIDHDGRGSSITLRLQCDSLSRWHVSVLLLAAVPHTSCQTCSTLLFDERARGVVRSSPPSEPQGHHIAVKAFDTTSTFKQMLKACDVTRLPGLIADNHILGKHETYPTFAPVISLRQNLDDLAPGRNVFLNPVPSYCLCPAFAMPRTRLITMLSTQIPGYSDGFWARVLEIVDIAHRNKSLLGNINVDDEVRPSERLHSTDDAINPAQLSLHPAAEGQND